MMIYLTFSSVAPVASANCIWDLWRPFAKSVFVFQNIRGAQALGEEVKEEGECEEEEEEDEEQVGGMTSAESDNSDEDEEEEEDEREEVKERKLKGKLEWDSSSITY